MPAFVPHQSWMLSQLDASLTNSPVDFDTNDIRCALIDSTLAPNPATHDQWSDLSANEVSGDGYTAGGFDFASMDVTNDSGTMKIDAEDAVWTQEAAGFTDARYAVLLKYDTGTPGNSVIIGSADLVSDRGNVSGPLTLQWHADGLLRLAPPA